MKSGVDAAHLDPNVVQSLGRLDLIAEVIATSARSGGRRSRFHGFSSEFSEFKAYAPGDDVRFLDWRIFARADRLFVRRFEAETELEVFLLLDATGSMAWRWQERISKLEYGANLLAALALLHVRAQDRVGLLLHDAERLHVVPPRCHRTQLERIFGLLDGVRPAGGLTLPLLADALAGWRRHRGRIILCTDLEEEPGPLEAVLERLAARTDEVALLHILDHAEITLPFSRATHLRDAETGEELAIDLEALRRGQRDAVEAFREEWRERCRRWGIGFVAADTATPYADAIAALAEAARGATLTGSGGGEAAPPRQGRG